jgi:hypothetical protein
MTTHKPFVFCEMCQGECQAARPAEDDERFALRVEYDKKVGELLNEITDTFREGRESDSGIWNKAARVRSLRAKLGLP